MPRLQRFRASDHALVRYLERVKGMNLDRARAEIAEMVGRAEDHGRSGVLPTGHLYRLRDGVVYTITAQPKQQDDA